MVCGRTAPTELLILLCQQTKIFAALHRRPEAKLRVTRRIARREPCNCRRWIHARAAQIEAVPKSKNPFSLLAKRVSRALAVFVFRSVMRKTGGARKLTIKSALVEKDTREPGRMSIGGGRRKLRMVLIGLCHGER
jgi:hypothetical protein